MSGVQTQNVFDLLEDGDASVEELSKKLAKQAAAKPAAAPAAATPKPAAASAVEARLRGGDAARGAGPGRGGAGGRGPAGAGRGRGDRPPRAVEGGDAFGEPAGRGRPLGGGRGDRGRGRGGGGAADGRRRDYDRRDGTGRGNETEKRHGAGRGNWGTEGAEGEGGGEGGGGGAPGEEGAPRRERRERRPPVEEDPATAAEREAAAAAAAAEAELEAKQMTLEQYEAAIKDKRAALNKAGGKGATVDASALEGLKPFEKVGVEAAVGLSAGKDIAGTRKSGAGGAAPSALAAGTKPAVATGFRIASGEERPPRDSEGGGRGGRGGRGGGRDGGGRGGGRGRGDSAGAAAAASRGGRTVTSSGPAPAINDSSAFPTLGA